MEEFSLCIARADEQDKLVAINDDECGEELYAVVQEQCLALPDPDQRFAMVRFESSIGV